MVRSAMKARSRLIVLSAAALLTGSATADFTPYVGEQQSGLRQRARLRQW